MGKYKISLFGDTGDAIEPKIYREFLFILVLGAVCFLVAGKYDLLEKVVDYSRQYEEWELDEILITTVFFTFALAIFAMRRLRETIQLFTQLRSSNEELNNALAEINQLKGIIPICSACKSIRDDKGYWHQVESYIRDHSGADFSHGICPTCMKQHYRDFIDRSEQTH